MVDKREGLVKLVSENSFSEGGIMRHLSLILISYSSLFAQMPLRFSPFSFFQFGVLGFFYLALIFFLFSIIFWLVYLWLVKGRDKGKKE